MKSLLALPVTGTGHAIGLVVMTTHGRGGYRRAILGSVADRLVRG